MGYGVEICGWEEREGMERLAERYLRWVLGVDRRTPGYLVREEFQREKLRGRAGRRVWGFERRLEGGGGSELARLCWEEIKERAGKRGNSSWEEGRRKFLNDRGMWVEGVGDRGEEEEARMEEMARWEREVQGQKDGRE